MSLDVDAVLHNWSAPIAVNVSLLLVALVYARGWLRLRIVSPGLISTWRLTAFLAGIACVWMAIGSPLEAFDDASLIVHMVQHLLLMSLAPPLLLLGAPELPFLHGLPQFITRGLAGPFFRLRSVKGLGRFITNPLVCWLAATFALIVWHVPAVFEQALRMEWLHHLEHATFLGAGLLFWWPVVQPWPSTARWPRWSIPLYLFCATLPCDALSAFLVFCDRVVYRSYLSAPRLFHFSALQDQECAAALMWTCITIILIVPAVIVTMEILAPARAQSPEPIYVGLPPAAPQPLDTPKVEVV